MSDFRRVALLLLVVALHLAGTGCTAEAGDRAAEPRHIVFMITEDPQNYEAHVNIPPFAEHLEAEHGYRTTVLLGEGEPTAFHFPGLEVLDEADLLVMFFRRRALPDRQMQQLRDYLDDGGPLIALRTTNHAFSLRDDIEGEPAAGHEDWWDFVPEVLGARNRGFAPVEPGTDVSVVEEHADHPILDGVEPTQWHTDSNLYLSHPLVDEEAHVLLRGESPTADGDDRHIEPIAWTRSANGSRVFYTSLGHPADFAEHPQFTRMLHNAVRWALQEE